MNRIPIILIFLICSCTSSIQTIGIYNNTQSEIEIETRPVISYNGSLEKYIDIEKDSTGRGLIWKVGEINSIVISPKNYTSDNHDTGIYIMKSKSGFEIGLSFNQIINQEHINLNYLKIITHQDTIIADTKQKIWSLINYDKKVKKLKYIIHEKAIIVN